MKSSKNLILGYWNIRGRAGAIRNLLHYCEVPYEEKLYKTKEEWFEHGKPYVDLDFPNLPYIIDGNVKIAETVALMNYIPIRGNKKELLGETDVNQVKVSEAISVVNDLRILVRNTCFTKGDFSKDFEELITKGQAKTLLTHFEKVLGKRDWVIGDLSIADFWLFEHIELISTIDKSKLFSYPNLLGFYKRFVEIPQVQAYRESDKFYKTFFFPAYNPTWNNAEKKWISGMVE